MIRRAHLKYGHTESAAVRHHPRRPRSWWTVQVTHSNITPASALQEAPSPWAPQSPAAEPTPVLPAVVHAMWDEQPVDFLPTTAPEGVETSVWGRYVTDRKRARDVMPQTHPHLSADYSAGERTYLDDMRRQGRTLSPHVWVDERLGRRGYLTADEWRFSLYRTWQQSIHDRSVPSLSGNFPALASFLDNGTADRAQLQSDLTRLVADRSGHPIHRPLVQIAERYLEFGAQR